MNRQEHYRKAEALLNQRVLEDAPPTAKQRLLIRALVHATLATVEASVAGVQMGEPH